MTFWEKIDKEFDEKFNNTNKAVVTLESHDIGSGLTQSPAQDDLKQFLHDTVEKALQEVLPEKQELDSGTIRTVNGFNDCCTEIKNNIKKLGLNK